MSKLLNRRGMVALALISVGAALYADPASSAIWAQIKSLEQQYKTNLAGIDQQINPLRQQIQSAESSLKPLQAQRETMATQYEDQRASLLDQVEPGYLAAYQTKKQAFDSAKTQHDQTIATANQQYTAARQQINAQFDAAVKGLKKK